MAWDFETESAFALELEWIDRFVREEVEPLDHVLGSPWDIHSQGFQALVRPLQRIVKERGLWACHLGPELGGQGFGQVKLALMNEIIGRSEFAPIVFGAQAPDSGNSEILAHYGTAAQKARYLEPLLANDIVSCFAMTEPQGGADPKQFTTRARRDGDQWVLSGEKWFASNARYADFFIVMAITDPDVTVYRGTTMFLVPADTSGVRILRNAGCADGEQTHAYIAFDHVRLEQDSVLGEVGEAFTVAQVRLGGGRVHHAMRVIGQAGKALDALCERALSRSTQGSLLADKQMVQERIADSWIELEQFRLLVMRTAWRIDKYQDYQKVRKDISAVKAAMPKVLHDIAARALHIHGSIGASNEMPFANLVNRAFQMGLADGPTEVHKVTVAKQLLREYQPCTDLFPAYHRPTAQAAAREKFKAVL
ncbi:acyl-CoA dehydrogenase family protein [Pseudomonas putida]|uniref:acyl-CoA dehydrogenase family protein n=1 Tax=Pseudomonas putida TaxID=303 RepID=UPI002364323A|nr:acyl-CoA dehydrogenase family protein [Pseudomonas putida]MDD2068691.1 acyl-CoA dehydrogenase family protein [Pseudomonas putida]HDS1738624.1 acyl-CoA dehydrogenase family protein [Pseudomonas putida]